jgi:hypothetical protein
MSRRDEELETHAIWNRLESVDDALSQVDGHIQESSTEALENAERVKSVVHHVRRLLDRADHHLLTLSQLNALDQSLQQVIQELNNFTSNGNEQHLAAATNNADSVVAHMSGLPAMTTLEDVGRLREDIASYRKSASALLRGLEGESEALKEAQKTTQIRNDELAATINEQKTRLDSAISAAQQQVQEVVSSTQGQASETLSRLQQQFSEAQDRRSTEFETQLRESLDGVDDATNAAKESVDQLVGDFEQRIGEQQTAMRAQGDELTDALNHQLEEAKRIVNVVGNIGMTGDYQRNANTQRLRADVLQAIAIVLFVGAAVLAVNLFGNSTAATLDVAQSIRRVALLALAVTPAWVALRLSRGHRDLEGRYRSMELELASLNPYLALLPRELQQAVKAELAARYFAGGDPEAAPLEVGHWLERLSSIAQSRERENPEADL